MSELRMPTLAFGLRHTCAAGALLALAILAALSLGGAPAHAVFPGLNGRIACEGLRGPVLDPPVPGASRTEIFSVNPDGSDEQVLTNNQTLDRDPAFSPDGTKVAFAGRRDNVEGEPQNTEIYVADNDGDLEGPDVKRLTFNDGSPLTGIQGQIAATDQSPSWSPDGTEIVFHSGRLTTFDDGGTTPARDFEIYKMSATNGERPGDGGFLTRLTERRGQDAIPSWSPDGGKIAFQGYELDRNSFFNLEIFTMNPDGTGRTNVSNSPGTPDDPDTAAREDSDAIDSFGTGWSPDGSQLAFGSTRDTAVPGNQNFEIYKVNRDGSSPTRMTLNLSGDTPFPEPHKDYDHAPTWSPDGTRLLFISGRTSTPDADEYVAYTMDANVGEAGGLQRVAESTLFGRCDWRAIQPPPPDPVSPLPLPPVPACPAGTSAGVVCAPNAAGGLNITGTSGADRIVGGAGPDVILCGDGDDVVSGGPGNDNIRCGAGNDEINGETGADVLRGESGNDVIGGDPGNDRLLGGSGRDRISGGSGNDAISGGSGNDVVSGNEGRDRINGRGGRDNLRGNEGPDRIAGDNGNDRISGGSGNDRLTGGSGNDRIVGNSGDDTINGNNNSDRLFGSSGNDRIAGGRTGNDRLAGGSGNDRLSGGSGRDNLVAGTGRDRLFGGNGRDVLNTRDRRRGDLANCGRGRGDLARVDRGDRVRRCGTVRRRR